MRIVSTRSLVLAVLAFGLVAVNAACAPTSAATTTPPATATQTLTPSPSPFPTATASPTATPSPSPTATNTPPPSATATESATATRVATATLTPVAFLGTGKWAGEVRRLQVFTTDLGNHSLYQALPYPIIEYRNTQTNELQTKEIVCTLLGSDPNNRLKWVWLEQNGTPHYFYSYSNTDNGGFAVPNTWKANPNEFRVVQAQDLSLGLVISLDLYPTDFDSVQSDAGKVVKLNGGVAINPGWNGLSKLQPVPQLPNN